MCAALDTTSGSGKKGRTGKDSYVRVPCGTLVSEVVKARIFFFIVVAVWSWRVYMVCRPAFGAVMRCAVLASRKPASV